jgi:hypothetical protein
MEGRVPINSRSISKSTSSYCQSITSRLNEECSSRYGTTTTTSAHVVASTTTASYNEDFSSSGREGCPVVTKDRTILLTK